MIFGIGTDIVAIARIEKILRKSYANNFVKKILTPYEMQCFEQYKSKHIERSIVYLASRFATKEAVAKAFGTGFRDGLSMQQIEVRNNELGKPELFFYQTAKSWLQQKHINNVHLSLADEKQYAIAYVVMTNH